MRLVDTDEEDMFLAFKGATITICCFLVFGVGLLVFIPQGDWLLGILHLLIGSAGIIFCLYEFLIYPYIKNQKEIK